MVSICKMLKKMGKCIIEIITLMRGAVGRKSDTLSDSHAFEPIIRLAFIV